ncbi:MAG TPA: hypothetical protein VF438_00975 [Candidatus Paceibacterota bacterium]
MKSIGDLFARIKNVQAKELFMRAAVQQALKKAANIDCDTKDISFKNFSVQIKNASQTAKTQLFLKKAAILKEIALQSPGRTISDIKFI